jgi:hypothetical protein
MSTMMTTFTIAIGACSGTATTTTIGATLIGTATMTVIATAGTVPASARSWSATDEAHRRLKGRLAIA